MELSALLSEAQIRSIQSNTREETVEDCIGGICYQYGIAFDSQAQERVRYIKRFNQSTIVCINEEGINFLPVIRDKNFAKCVGERLKRGGVVWMHDNTFREVTWDNWKHTYAMLCPKVPVYTSGELDKPSKKECAEIKETRRLDRFFNEMKSVDRYKKMGKRGFNANFDELKRKWQIAEFDKQFYATKRRAKEIMQQVEL